MVETKSLAQTEANWKNAIGRVPAAYADGVRNAKDVINKAIAGEALYAEKMQEAIQNQSRARGLQKVSDEDWRSAALNKGAARIGQGMTEAAPKFSKGMAQVLSVIQGVSLPARVADPVQNVQNRVVPIVEALAAMKK